MLMKPREGLPFLNFYRLWMYLIYYYEIRRIIIIIIKWHYMPRTFYTFVVAPLWGHVVPDLHPGRVHRNRKWR